MGRERRSPTQPVHKQSQHSESPRTSPLLTGAKTLECTGAHATCWPLQRHAPVRRLPRRRTPARCNTVQASLVSPNALRFPVPKSACSTSNALYLVGKRKPALQRRVKVRQVKGNHAAACVPPPAVVQVLVPVVRGPGRPHDRQIHCLQGMNSNQVLMTTRAKERGGGGDSNVGALTLPRIVLAARVLVNPG